MGDTTPLRETVARLVDDDGPADRRGNVKGLLLLIMTANLGTVAQQLIWNIGAIAARWLGSLCELIIKILMASLAHPGAFSPGHDLNLP